jgi:hypothetical protein
LHKLSAQFPAPSSYADQLAILSDYFDNQVPLSVENRSLLQRIAVLEASIERFRKTETITPIKVPNTGIRRGIDCTSWMGDGRCTCPACKVGAHA